MQNPDLWAYRRQGADRPLNYWNFGPPLSRLFIAHLKLNLQFSRTPPKHPLDAPPAPTAASRSIYNLTGEVFHIFAGT